MAVFKGNVTIGTFIERGAKVEQVNNTISQDASTDQSQHPTQVNAVVVEKEDELLLVDDLMPVFMNRREEVERYLKAIMGAKQNDITRITKQLVVARIISEEFSHKYLYDILYKHKIYTCSLSNWNKQL